MNFFRALGRFDSQWKQRVVFQILGVIGVTKSVYRMRAWLRRLWGGPIERYEELPPPKFPMVVPDDIDAKLAHYSTAEHLSVLP